MQKIFNFHGLEIFDVEEISTHGGSLRIFVQHHNNKQNQMNDSIENLIKKEKDHGLDKISTYQNFSEKIQNVKKKLNDFVELANKEGKSIVCYGAPAKGNTLLNFCGIVKQQIDFVVDRSPYKQGLFLPGSHIPIKSVEAI